MSCKVFDELMGKLTADEPDTADADDIVAEPDTAVADDSAAQLAFACIAKHDTNDPPKNKNPKRPHTCASDQSDRHANTIAVCCP